MIRKRRNRKYINAGWRAVFNPDNLEVAENAESYAIVLPPPNVTGTLHMGHALNATIQDILIRRKRMQGFRTLWLPALTTPASPHRM